jgi:prepilin-type N-terminal cleavage/methylation domain-containing protein
MTPIKKHRHPAVRKDHGFTIIELMIILAILAILVALAVPAYKDYTIRSKISECINGAAVAKIQISEFRQTLGAWPGTIQDAGINHPSGESRYCTGFALYDGATGAFNIDINESEVDPVVIGEIAPRLTPTPAALSGMINWTCSNGDTSAGNFKYLPAPCRNT